MKKPTTPHLLDVMDYLQRLHLAKTLAESQPGNERLHDACKTLTSVLAIYFGVGLKPAIQARHQLGVEEFDAAVAEAHAIDEVSS